MPVKIRWEVTRRHPYYLVFWQNAVLYRQGLLGDHPAQGLLRHAASLILGAIGVTGEPVPPATEFEDLGAVDPAFLSGAVQPMTLRSVAAMLINALPPAERAAVGALFITSGDREYAVEDDDDQRTIQKRTALARLGQISSPALDSYPDTPLYYIHLSASQRTIVQDLEDQVRRWKNRRNIPERRLHTTKLSSYLEVWDLREGWTGRGYDRAQEQTFHEIARRLHQPMSTIASRYRSAFQMISGTEFSSEYWWRLMGPLKFSELMDPTVVLSAPIRRLLRTPVPRPAPDSVVSPATKSPHASSIVEQQSAVGDDHAWRDLLMDLEDLVSQGLPDEDIAQRLERPVEVISLIRSRLGDFREF